MPDGRLKQSGLDDLLFPRRDRDGNTRPLVKKATMDRVNEVLTRAGSSSTFGHSFRIGGASGYPAQKVDPEMVRIAGQWKSLAYEVHIRSLEQVISKHLAYMNTW